MQIRVFRTSGMEVTRVVLAGEWVVFVARERGWCSGMGRFGRHFFIFEVIYVPWPWEYNCWCRTAWALALGH
jgi:hypothetical protein